jgi:arylsulfatase A-like enzyme
MVAPFAPHEPPSTYHADGSAAPTAPEPAPGDEHLYADAEIPLEPVTSYPSGEPAFVEDSLEARRSSVALNSRLEDQAVEIGRGRLAAMASVESMMNEIITSLEESGELQNTYVIFTSDNGFHLGEQGLLPGGTSTPYEADVRVPLFIRGPGMPPGTVIREIVSTIDIPATLADIAGLQPKLEQDGRSLLVLIETGGADWRSSLLLEYAAAADDGVPSWAGLRSDVWKYVEWSDGHRELYDIHADPEERRNLIDSDGSDLPDIEQLERELTEARHCPPGACWK